MHYVGIKARGYAYAKTEYVSVRTYLSKIEYAYDTFRSVRFTQTYARLVVYPFTPMQVYQVSK